jgi:uncharacterized membrane protein
MVAFSGLVVSVAVLVVQFGAGQYSPRLVPSFRSDAVIKNALGLFVAPGVYALVAATNLFGSTDDRVGTATVLVALALMIAALVALFRFIGRLLDLMRPRRIYARLLSAFAAAVEDVYPRPGAAGIELRALTPGPVSSVLRHGHRNELLIGVDRARLVQAARAAGAIIEITSPIGSHIGDDAPILLVRGGSPVDPTALRRALTFADGRRLQEDPAFAIRCTVDVAIRALSPAVNDPTTAIQMLNHIEIFIEAVTERGHRAGAFALVDPDGVERLVAPSRSVEDFLLLATTEIMDYGGRSIQVCRRLLALFDSLDVIIDPADRPALQTQRARLDALVTANFAESEQMLARRADGQGIGGAGTGPAESPVV